MSVSQPLLRRRAALLAVVDVMADQLVQGEGVQRFLVRLERDQVMPGQVLEAVRQQPGRFAGLLADQHQIEQLPAVRQVQLLLHGEATALAQVDP
jgi:hypothetical protein